MPIPVRCPGCQANFKAPDQMAGRAASCPKCQTKLQIPALAPAAAMPQATALPQAMGLPTAKPLPVATAIPTAKPPLPAVQSAHAAPGSPSLVTAPNAPAELPPAKESIFKKRWSVDKIILNIVAIVIFIWFMKGLLPVLNRDISPNRPAAGSR